MDQKAREKTRPPLLDKAIDKISTKNLSILDPFKKIHDLDKKIHFPLKNTKENEKLNHQNRGTRQLHPTETHLTAGIKFGQSFLSFISNF